MPRPELADALDLAPHPEGGWYRRTWTSPVTIATPRGERPSATAILYLLDAPGRWHRVRSTELWLWHSGPAAELVLGGSGDAPGDELVHELSATSPQGVVAPGAWQRASPLGNEPVLVSCVVSPGFAFSDFELR